MSSRTLQKLSVFAALIAFTLLGQSPAAGANEWGALRSDTYSLNRWVSESAPTVVFRGQPRYVESIDVNWRGAYNQSVTARILADGREVWSGMIPAYDPTFHATVRAQVSEIELRVDTGSAYVNWAKVFSADEGASAPREPRPCVRNGCRPHFIGSLTEADDLAWSMVQVINQIDPLLALEDVRAHLLPLKTAAAKVFAVAKASGNMRQGDIYDSVFALEQEFRRQEAFLLGLLNVDATFQEGVSLMTIRERYKALFGHTEYRE